MPHVAGAILGGIELKFKAFWGLGIFWSEVDDQGHPGGMARKDGKVYALLEPGNASGQRVASFSYFWSFLGRHINNGYYYFVA